MNRKLKEWISSETSPYIVLLVLMVILNIKMNINFGDDIDFSNQSQSVWKIFVDCYHNWGSPSPVTFFNLWLGRLPIVDFKVCNVLTILLVQYSIVKITYDKNSKYTQFMIIVLIGLYPFLQMRTAGWIASSTTYIFPLSFGLYSFVYLKCLIDNKEISRLNYILFWISLVLGAGGIQLCCIMFGIYSIYNIFFIIKRKYYKFLMLQNITSLLFVVYHIIAPGNAKRNFQETITWFPDFNMISTVNKTKLGFSSTLGNLISGPNLFFLCFSVLLVIGVYCKYKSILYRTISLIPLGASLIFGLFSTVFSNVFHDLILLMNNGTYDFLQINIYNFDQKINYLSIIVGFTILGAILTSIYLIFENTLKMIIVEMIFIAGFSSRMIMSFSPTIYASSTRTFIYLYFAMIICGILIFNNISEYITGEKQKKILMYIGIISAINYLQLLIIV